MQPPKSKILYVEDHDDTRELVALVLEQANYEVITTPSLAGALKLAKSAKFDLFVLDSLLGDGNGIDLCKRIRRLDDSTPILFCSAKAYDTDKNEAFSSGAQRYLVKPVEISVLCRTVAELLSGRNGSDGHSDGDGQRRNAVGNGKI
jgi:two-component system phosphate regulon response regulator PhoB